jgi:hypothetical protein
MPYLLPNDLDPDVFKCLTIRVPDDPQWEVNFWGALLELAKWFNHDRDALHKGKIVADKWRGWIDDSMACNTITGITIVNSKLLVQYCNSDVWVTVGPVSTIPMRYNNGKLEYDINGDGTFEVSFYNNIQQNFLGQGEFPITDDNDRICRASWAMAREMADNMNDIVRAITSGSKLLAGAMQMLASWTVIAQPAEETIEYFSDELPQSVLDFFGSKITDPDTIKKIAEMLYCSLVENYPDDLDNVINDIPLGIYAPIATLDPTKIQWTNFGDIMQSIYDSLLGPNTAYLVIAYAKVSIQALSVFNFLPTPVRQTMTQALATAEYFDSRDCVGFPCEGWTHTFEGEDLYTYWELFDPSENYSGFWEETGNLWYMGTIINPDPEVGGAIHRLSLQLRTPLTSEANIKTIVINFDPQAENIGSFSAWYADNEDWEYDEEKYVPYSQETAEYTIEKQFTVIRFDMAADGNYPGESGAYIRPIKSITLSGQGNDPFM